MKNPGPKKVLMPTTSACEVSFLGSSESNIMRCAAFMATKDEEHAVSYDEIGPRKSKRYEILPAVPEQLVLVARIVGSSFSA